MRARGPALGSIPESISESVSESISRTAIPATTATRSRSGLARSIACPHASSVAPVVRTSSTRPTVPPTGTICNPGFRAPALTNEGARQVEFTLVGTGRSSLLSGGPSATKRVRIERRLRSRCQPTRNQLRLIEAHSASCSWGCQKTAISVPTRKASGRSLGGTG